MARPRLRVGDVFVVPTGDGRAGFGQIVAPYEKGFYFFAIFDLAVPLDEAPSRFTEGLAAPVRFLALSMDAKLYVGHWYVVANAPVDPTIPLPAYKLSVGSPTNLEVVDYSGQRRRRATRAEAASLPYRDIVAPVLLERALRASLGLEPWLEPFDELRVENVVPSSSLF